MNPTSQDIAGSPQLYDLLKRLHTLGVDFPQLLIELTQIVQPQLQQHEIIPVLQQMFEGVPRLLEKNSIVTLQKISELQKEGTAIRLLLEFRELQTILQTISYLQLLHLTNNIIPPGPQQIQLQFLKKAQEQFQTWTPETLQNHHHELSETPLHMERQRLLELEPHIPWELLHFLIELLKLPLEDLLNFQEWISKLPEKQLIIMIKLIQMEQPAAIIELKRRLDFDGDIMMDDASEDIFTDLSPDISIMESPNGISFDKTPSHPSTLGTVQPRESNASVTPSSGKFSVSTDNLTSYQLRVMRQPPGKTVYQRILKPFPSIMLVGGNSEAVSPNSNLFVEATLLRADSDAELPSCIEGTRIVRISGVFATFKKLKVLSTSQQQGTLFRLKFSLKRYVGHVFEQVGSATVVSNPIEVFSHTLYLSDKQEAPAPPTVSEVLPPCGGVGARVVVLGNNFVNSPKLKVRFGEYEVLATFHEQGTLICTIPAYSSAEQVPVRVSNDGVNFCQTKVFFTLMPNRNTLT